MKTWIGVVLAVIVVGGGAYWWMQQGQLAPTGAYQEQTNTPTNNQANPSAQPAQTSSAALEFKAIAGNTFTLKIGQTATDGNGGITVKLKTVTGGQYPSTVVKVVSASSTVEAGLAETAKTWGLTQDEYVPGSGVGSELIWSAKWGYSSWPDLNSPTGSVRLKVIAIDPAAQTVTFQVNTDPVPSERG